MKQIYREVMFESNWKNTSFEIIFFFSILHNSIYLYGSWSCPVFKSRQSLVPSNFKPIWLYDLAWFYFYRFLFQSNVHCFNLCVLFVLFSFVLYYFIEFQVKMVCKNSLIIHSSRKKKNEKKKKLRIWTNQCANRLQNNGNWVSYKYKTENFVFIKLMHYGHTKHILYFFWFCYSYILFYTHYNIMNSLDFLFFYFSFSSFHCVSMKMVLKIAISTRYFAATCKTFPFSFPLPLPLTIFF